MCPYSTTTSATDQGGGAAITAIHAEIIQTHILNRLDGSTLASTSCASTQLKSLCSDNSLWRQICNSTWPSTTHPLVDNAISNFPSGHHSFFSDAFTAPHNQKSHHKSNLCRQQRLLETKELISAVDVYYDDKLIYSKVISNEILSGWFLSSPFRVELLDPKETVAAPVNFSGEEGTCMTDLEERMRLSWIVIDPARSRAVNVASSKAVEARRHWLSEDIQLRYTTVVEAVGGEVVECGVVVTCGGEEGGELHVREVCMQVEDMEGKILCGMDSLGILQEAMEGQRRKCDYRVEKENYEMFLRKKIEFRERTQRREKGLDLVFMAIGVTIFFAISTFFVMR